MDYQPREPITLRSFHDWLHSHQAGEVVGRGHDCRHCPVAEYLRWIYEPRRPAVSVAEKTYCLDIDTVSMLPASMQRFIYLIDASVTMTGKIVLETALAVLAEVEQEYPLEPKPRKQHSKDEDQPPPAPKAPPQGALF